MATHSRTLFLAGALVGATTVARAAARRRRRIDFAGRVALVTGGSRGLGLALARELAAEGARVVICARDEAELSRARVDLVRRGADAVAIPCDVTDEAEVRGMLDQIRQRLGPVEILINNAGVIQVGPVDAMTQDDYEQALRVHLRAPLLTTFGVLPDMRRRGEGRIVNIASVGGKISVAHLLPYSTSKFALVGFSSGLRDALARDGIYVTTVCPGLMRTGSPRNASFKGRHRNEFAWFSIADALPLLSMRAPDAARRIVEACRDGRAELVMPLPIAAAVKLHALAPGLAADVLGVVEALLPRPGGIGTESRPGSQSESAWSPSLLTRLSDEAAVRNNEVAR
ncbi:MAG: SDR family NAD(P)-dependent oxidoreductase [Gemmatimonadales bacterium]